MKGVVFCSFSGDDRMYDVTVVENLFIREFMTHAPGDFVRVYLFGLMLCYHPSEDMSVERVAKALDIEVEAVLNAYRYWEREGAVKRISDKPPAYQYINLKSAMMVGGGAGDDLYAYREFNNRLQAIFGGERLLHPHEFSKAHEWAEDLRLPTEVILLMVKSYVEKRKSFRVSFSTLEKVALQWAESGITSVAEAQDMLGRESEVYKAAQSVLKQFNLRRAPTVDEQNFARIWLEEWGLSADAVINACRETVNASSPSFGYLNKVLENHRTAATAGQMDDRLKAARSERDAVKAVLRTLGAQQSAPTDAQVSAYGQYLAAGFDAEGILLIAGRLNVRGRHTMDDLDGALAKYLKHDLITAQQINRYMEAQQAARDYAEHIMEICGLDRMPTPGDIALAGKWQAAANAPLVEYAAQCAVGTQTPMRYIDGLLTRWAENGIVDVAAAQHAKRDKRDQREKPQAVNPALQYEQRPYQAGDFDHLFVDLEGMGDE